VNKRPDIFNNLKINIMNTILLLIVSCVVGGYAMYRIIADTGKAIRLNGFGLYIFKYTCITVVKWAFFSSAISGILHQYLK